MARAKPPDNGRLEELIAIVLQTQATMQQNTAAMQAEMREFQKQFFEIQRRIDERFTRIDDRFARIEAILLEHNRILMALPDAVRDKIGFKGPPDS